MDLEFLSSFANEFLMQLAPAVAVFLAGWIAKVAGELWDNFQRRQPKVADYIGMAAKMAVSAAERAGADGYIKDKKEYAIEIAQSYLNSVGLKNINVSLIAAAIEEAGIEMMIFSYPFERKS